MSSRPYKMDTELLYSENALNLVTAIPLRLFRETYTGRLMGRTNETPRLQKTLFPDENMSSLVSII